ncbi:uncharacterized protein LOC135649342 [Musa acuminata AAA Group]|uniref:uncharacterized protein LOC135594209 n=1 Tax=Musa acuminata AAA Group TaxID=214697 RepID=UPI0031E12AC0
MESKSLSLGLGSGRCGSSKRGRRSNSEKAKRPQRGLGVAQLEKIRLQGQLNQHVSIHNNLCMEEYDDDGKRNIIDCDEHWFDTIRRSRSNVPLVTLPLIEQLLEQSIKDYSTQKKHSIIHKYDPNEAVEELDLELKLSL